MPNSYFQFINLTCPKCKNVFETNIWLIVDTAERPDLLEDIKTGRQTSCPYCGHQGNLNVPVLLYRPNAEPRLLFSPAQGISQEKGKQQGQELLARLKESLGAEWHEEWLQKGLLGISRKMLLAMLDENPEAALRELAERKQQELERLRREDPQQFLQTMMEAFLKTDDPGQKRTLLENTPELLADNANTRLMQLVKAAQEKNDENARQVFEQHLTLLRRCREVGIEKAFAEKNQSISKDISVKLNDILQEINQLTRLGDMPRRIELCQQALNMVSRQNQPKLWASLQDQLAISLAQSPLGNLAENLEEAIHHSQLALKIYTHRAFPERWAGIQNNLASAYTERICGERAENLEQAIHYCQQALKVYTQEAFPERWAGTQNNLASVYSERIRGERAENLEQAIQYYQQALKVYTRKVFPSDWAMTQTNLADTYRDRIRGERVENLEQAILLYQQAHKVYTCRAFPERWANTHDQLGITYRDRIRGERAENLEQAIHHSRLALKVFTHRAFPERWASTQNSLANAYTERIRGERAENLELTILLYLQALKVYTQQDFPEQWAGTQIDLANAYGDRIRGERDENIEQAIQYCQQALKVFTLQAFPERWAGTQNNLASAYTERICGERDENIEQAIQYCQQALKVFTLQAFPEWWAGTQHNLGLAYSDRIRGERAENLEQAIDHFQQALKVRTYQAYPAECRITTQWLGQIAFEQKHWELALVSYHQALDAQRVLMGAAFSRTGKQAEIGKMQTLPGRLAYACIQLGQPERAIEGLEQGHAQLLRESLERNRRDLTRLPALGFGILYEQFIHTSAHYDGLLAQSTNENRSVGWLAQIEDAHQEMQNVAEAIRQQAGEKHPEFRFFLQTLPFAEIQQQAQDAPLVYLATTPAGGLALIITKQGAQAVELPGLTIEGLGKEAQGYIHAYFPWRTDPNNPEKLVAWKTQLDATLSWLSENVMQAVVKALRSTTSRGQIVRLVPSDLLVLFPLHAAWTGKDHRYALDEFTFTYVPSAQALYYAHLAADRPAESLLAVDNPDGSLHYTESEVEAVLEHFPGKSTHLLNGEARKDAVRQVIGAANVLHFSTHGIAGWSKAETARLKLADGDLTMTELFDLHLESARLAVLSACETGIPGTELPDEVVSLPSAWMQAGVPGVVGSLWSVDDMSTAILMGRFYDLWCDKGLPAPKALRQAQIWLRDSTIEDMKRTFKESAAVPMSRKSAKAFYASIGWEDPGVRFAHPFYWAAFDYSGL
jgi:CHAT domain-containing protein/tetratricopeptide (TPR) repeat protein/DNA-directed RNA polymerase subunit RPC12/RpoP